MHCDYNPSFYGQAPEPIAKNLKEFENYIKQTKHVDFGLCTDGDADRIGIFDGKGNFIDAHHIILMLIYVLHEYKEMRGKVVIGILGF
jgi:phosphomannomutase